jgi:hypothetical protein
MYTYNTILLLSNDFIMQTKNTHLKVSLKSYKLKRKPSVALRPNREKSEPKFTKILLFIFIFYCCKFWNGFQHNDNRALDDKMVVLSLFTNILLYLKNNCGIRIKFNICSRQLQRTPPRAQIRHRPEWGFRIWCSTCVLVLLHRGCTHYASYVQD